MSKQSTRRFRGQRRKLYRTNPDGSKSIPLNAETIAAVDEMRREFVTKFGREPGPGDPVFFDPDRETPETMSAQSVDRMKRSIREAMVQAGIRPQLIHAFDLTGRIVTRENMAILTDAELSEWEEALKSYKPI